MTLSNVTRRGMIGGLAVGVGAATVITSGPFSSTAPALSQRQKTFVLDSRRVGGYWCWRRVSDKLEKQGHKVYAPSLTGLADRSHLLSKDVNLDTHITDIANLVEWEGLTDICLVAHSYGGYPASGALERVGNRVSSIIWVDGRTDRDMGGDIDPSDDLTQVVGKVAFADARAVEETAEQLDVAALRQVVEAIAGAAGWTSTASARARSSPLTCNRSCTGSAGSASRGATRTSC